MWFPLNMHHQIWRIFNHYRFFSIFKKNKKTQKSRKQWIWQKKCIKQKRCKTWFYIRNVLWNFLYLQLYIFYYRKRFSKNPTLSRKKCMFSTSPRVENFFGLSGDPLEYNASGKPLLMLSSLKKAKRNQPSWWRGSEMRCKSVGYVDGVWLGVSVTSI